MIGACGFLVPSPSILERLYLRGGTAAVLLLEQDVVVLIGLERRVKMNSPDLSIQQRVCRNVLANVFPNGNTCCDRFTCQSASYLGYASDTNKRSRSPLLIGLTTWLLKPASFASFLSLS